MLLNLNEYKDISQMIDIVDSYVTDDVYDKAEYFDMEEDEDSLLTTVTLYNSDQEKLVSFEVEDYDLAKEYLNDLFDIDEEDMVEYDYDTVEDV